MHKTDTALSAICVKAMGFVTLIGSLHVAASLAAQEPEKFNIWVGSDPHVTVDTLHGVEPMRLAFRQSEGFWSFLPAYEIKAGGIPPAFDWDMMLLAGDLTSSQFPPRDGEGVIFVDQFKALGKHYREDVFTLAGNHDGSYYDTGAGSWFQKWADPMGENTAHHHVLRDTTTISIENGGVGIHANNTGDFEGASYLYYTIENADPENFEYSTSTAGSPGPFERFLEEFQQEHGRPAIDVWVGAHSHAMATDVIDGRGLDKNGWYAPNASTITLRNQFVAPEADPRPKPGGD